MSKDKHFFEKLGGFEESTIKSMGSREVARELSKRLLVNT